MCPCAADLMKAIEKDLLKSDVPQFRVGDTLRVHAKIVEGSKERVQIFEGVVIKKHRRAQATATFTVRKLSYNIGVERTFPLHSPRIEKIEIVARGDVRRGRLFYLRDLRGKSARIKGRLEMLGGTVPTEAVPTEEAESKEAAASKGSTSAES